MRVVVEQLGPCRECERLGTVVGEICGVLIFLCLECQANLEDVVEEVEGEDEAPPAALGQA